MVHKKTSLATPPSQQLVCLSNLRSFNPFPHPPRSQQTVVAIVIGEATAGLVGGAASAPRAPREETRLVGTPRQTLRSSVNQTVRPPRKLSGGGVFGVPVRPNSSPPEVVRGQCLTEVVG